MKKFLLSLVLVIFMVSFAYPATDSYMFTVDETLKWKVAKHVSSAFTGGAGNHGDFDGTTEIYQIFTITGAVAIRFCVGFVNVNLTTTTGTISIGTTASPTYFADVEAAGNLTVGLSWVENQVPADIVAHKASKFGSSSFVSDTSIIEITETADVTEGQIDYFCAWAPLESGASVIGAGTLTE